MKRFVYLEFTDPKISNLLSDIRAALQGQPYLGPIHITVRGPYDNTPEISSLEALQEALTGYGVLLSGIGIFKINSGYSVHIKAQSPVFNQLWWKPDYPTDKYGINPHITLFESSEQSTVKKVVQFLRSEEMEIFTFSIRLSTPTPKQLRLFDLSLDAETLLKRSPLERWKVRPGIIQRAESFGKQIRAIAKQ